MRARRRLGLLVGLLLGGWAVASGCSGDDSVSGPADASGGTGGRAGEDGSVGLGDGDAASPTAPGRRAPATSAGLRRGPATCPRAATAYRPYAQRTASSPTEPHAANRNACRGGA